MKQLIILGKDNLNNSLLASYIETNTSHPCYIINLSSHVTFDESGFELANLVLLDCNNLNDKEIKGTLNKCGNILLDNSHIALFNTNENINTDYFSQHPLVMGIFSDDVCHQQFIAGIKSIFNGELWLSRKLLSNLVIKNRKNPKPQSEDYGLTQRETEIIKLVAVGSRNNDIADILCLSPHTVKTHIYHIYKKLNVENRMQAANWANQHWGTHT